MKLHICLFLFFGLSLSLLAKGKDEEASTLWRLSEMLRNRLRPGKTRGELQMLDSEGGALELLAEGMYVRVAYFETQGYRIALNLEQIPVDPSLNH